MCAFAIDGRTFDVTAAECVREGALLAFVVVPLAAFAAFTTAIARNVGPLFLGALRTGAVGAGAVAAAGACEEGATGADAVRAYASRSCLFRKGLGRFSSSDKSYSTAGAGAAVWCSFALEVVLDADDVADELDALDAVDAEDGGRAVRVRADAEGAGAAGAARAASMSGR